VLGPCFLQGFLAPGIPVHRVIRMLQQIGRGRAFKVIHRVSNLTVTCENELGAGLLGKLTEHQAQNEARFCSLLIAHYSLLITYRVKYNTLSSWITSSPWSYG